MAKYRNERFARCLVYGINGDVARVLFFDDDDIETIREVPVGEFRYISRILTRGPSFANVKVLLFCTYLFEVD